MGLDDWRVSLRDDVFQTRHPAATPSIMNEDGHATTVALSWQHFDWLRLTGEMIAMQSRRGEYVLAGFPDHRREPAAVPALRPVFLLARRLGLVTAASPARALARWRRRCVAWSLHSCGPCDRSEGALQLYEYYHTIRTMLDHLTLQDNGVPIYVQLRDQIAGADRARRADAGRAAAHHAPGRGGPGDRSQHRAARLCRAGARRAADHGAGPGQLRRRDAAAAPQPPRRDATRLPPRSPPRPRRRASPWTNWSEALLKLSGGGRHEQPSVSYLRPSSSPSSSSGLAFCGCGSDHGCAADNHDSGRRRIAAPAPPSDISIPSSRIPNTPQETHMNPISALIFIVFLGGAALSFVARMPLPVTIVLALIGIFLGYSDQDGPAMGTGGGPAAGQAAGRQGAGPLHPGADLRPGGDVDRPAHPHHRGQCRTGPDQGHGAGECRRHRVLDGA